ncbi:MAG: hypothetical protein KGL95_14035 [Patescibacteria group bacterium]|nr:hypothetical protein [Patescibacteria group bacterium]
MAIAKVDARDISVIVRTEVVAMPQPARKPVRRGSPVRKVTDPLPWRRPPLPQLPPRPEPEEEPGQEPVPQPSRPAPTPLRNIAA